MPRQPEEQNQLVGFDETPATPPRPDVGINIDVAPRQAKPDEPIILSAAYNADGALLSSCPSDLAACITLQVVEIADRPDRFDQTLPLQLQLDDIMPPRPVNTAHTIARAASSSSTSRRSSIYRRSPPNIASQ